MDLFGGPGRGKGKGNGKGKGKKGEKGDRPGKDPNAPREANPKQVFVANIGDAPEEEIRDFFEEAGEVDRVRLLRTPEGASKGVCFVTFRTEMQAQQALALNGRPFQDKNIVVRVAHAGNVPKGSEKGGGKGPDRPMDSGALDLGGSERFGAAFGGDRDRDAERERPRNNAKGKGRGSGGRPRGSDRGEMDELLEEALADNDGPLKTADFDFAARRFLMELRSRDKADGTNRFQEAMDMVLKYANQKDREDVRKWPAYVFTLLSKFDPAVAEEIKERDADNRRQKAGADRRERRPSDEDDEGLRPRRTAAAPPLEEGSKQASLPWRKDRPED